MRRSVPILSALAALLVTSIALAQLPRTPAPAGAQVYFISPKDGEEIAGPITVRMGLKGMGVAPAGVEMKDTGHHHLLINVVTLPPGRHTLQLVLGDQNHIPHEPPVISPKITITVK